MFITDHSIRRYKQRIGKKTASKRRIFTQINRDLERDVHERKPSKVPNYYILVTSKYEAVCFKSRVITICLLDQGHNAWEKELGEWQTVV